jgi:hypothetical protein
MAIMSLAVVVGHILAWLGQRWEKAALAINILVALLILFEYLPAPLSLADRSVPLIYQTILQDKEPGSVLDMPFGINDSFTNLGGWNPQAMYYQTITAKPIIGAHISRVPSAVIEAYAQMPIIGRLAKIEEGADYNIAEVHADQLYRDDVIKLIDLRYIVISASYEKEPGSKYILQVFNGCLEPVSSDHRALGYRVLRPCPALTPSP